jgi:hypothetical protein
MKEFMITFIPCTIEEVRADCNGAEPLAYTNREGKFNEVYINTDKFDVLPRSDQCFIIAHEAQHAFIRAVQEEETRRATKSDMVRDIAEKLGFPVIEMKLAPADPADYIGYPEK